MMHRHSGWSIASMAAAGLWAVACSTAITSDTDGDGGSTSTSQSASSSSTSGSGGEGGGSACEQDCSALQTPPCLQSVCDEASGQCAVVNGPSGGPCDDGLFCTVGETCDEGVCGDGAPNTCGLPFDACGAAVCDEASASCSTTPLPNGSPCVLDEFCVVNPKCQNGQCVGSPKDCFFAPVPDACHVSMCNPNTGDCEPQPGNDGVACPNDGDLCMVNKTCAGGMCLGGAPKNCSAFTNGCNNGVCNPVDGACFSEAVPPGGACIEATDDCNTGICDNNGDCNPVAANEGAACNDGNSCTMGETCQGGGCLGGVVGNYVSYFTETFASNTAGWTLGLEWQIGSAMESVGFVDTGNQDPALDHTANADNGIAGVVIGGYPALDLHAPYYLESPIIDTSVAPGPVYLEFWRFLNSDYADFMDNTIDVFNGVTWINIWTSGPVGIEDAAWTKISHDITAHKNAGMRVRFGFDIGAAGVYTVSSWNVDDVVIANAACD